MVRSFTKNRLLILVEALFVVAALALSIVSSNTLYALNHLSTIMAACAAVLVIDVVTFAADGKLPVLGKDILFFAAAFLIGLALCTMISGRVLLIGYIYFSDLESSNPVAILAMHLAIASWVCYGLAIVTNGIIGFSRDKKA